MKIAAISDTHGLHHQLIIPQADMLLHSGDVSVKGTEAEILDFLDWFSQQRHKHKVFIAGNHDFFFEGKSKKELNKIIPENIHYLNNELLEIEGLKIWGSPHTPKPKKRWAFNRERGQDIQKEWDQIPENLDILIVHGPAKGILDLMLNNEFIGCKNLYETVLKKKPKLFICGHIHESRGEQKIKGTHFVNASSVDRFKTQLFPAFEIEIQTAKEAL